MLCSDAHQNRITDTYYKTQTKVTSWNFQQNIKTRMAVNISNLNVSKNSIPPVLKYKIVFLGDQAVGKSSIINRFIYDIFNGDDHRPTIGIDFISQNIYLEERTIRLQLWDTAGQERFRSLIPNYIRDSAVAILVYDVTNRSSFESIPKWVQDVKTQRGGDAVICLLANKIDLDRQVSTKEGMDLAHKNRLLFMEISAKTGLGIQQFFKEVAGKLPGTGTGQQRKTPETQNQPQAVVLQTVSKDEERAKKKSCC